VVLSQKITGTTLTLPSQSEVLGMGLGKGKVVAVLN
jgi:hypothetical protein